MIWLLRHADAVHGGPDAERELTERGVKQATNVGRALAALGVTIDICLTSPKVRAHHTATLACVQLGVKVEICAELAGEALDPVDLALGRGEVMLVGHDPSISQALTDQTGAVVHMKKGGLAAIDSGELVVLLRPTELTAIAHGTEAGK